MTTYNPDVLKALADALYEEARALVLRSVALGAVLCGVAALYAKTVFGDWWQTAAIGAALLGAWIGREFALPRAFRLKVQAQQILCWVKIEENTRRA